MFSANHYTITLHIKADKQRFVNIILAKLWCPLETKNIQKIFMTINCASVRIGGIIKTLFLREAYSTVFPVIKYITLTHIYDRNIIIWCVLKCFNCRCMGSTVQFESDWMAITSSLSVEHSFVK